MLARRIIPCLDIKDGHVVKGVRFKGHESMGKPIDLALRYRDEGADELVLYDITASADRRDLDLNWITEIARNLDIPFCVAGGIRTRDQALRLLSAGADKISINSPALERPELIAEIAEATGSQCVVVGIDSLKKGDEYVVHQYTGSEKTIQTTNKTSLDWACEAQRLGAGEIVLNCMNQDGVRLGYDCEQLRLLRNHLTIPLIASGGAGQINDFIDVFKKADVSGALAASVFHKNIIIIAELKQALKSAHIAVRL
jgi:imidazole glycerol-phosphate synthase subunit HisF